MLVKQARIKNYRLLKDVVLTFDKRSTLIVGRNNTGKTSLAEVFRTFLSSSGPKVRYADFNQGSLAEFETALENFEQKKLENEIRESMPTIELELLFDYTDDSENYGALGDFIVDLNEELFETAVLISYQLKDGKINDFFQALDTSDRAEYFSDLRDQINKYYEPVIYAVEPTNRNNRVKLDFAKIRSVLLHGVINAQRGLDDETHNERDVLGKSLGKIFNSASNENAPDAFKSQSNEVNEVVEKMQATIDTDFQEKVQALLPALNIFGYPGLQDPNLRALTELDVTSLLERNTKVFYQGEDHFSLPETYNGLGMRNLIFILFRVYEYFREFQSAALPAKAQLIFIEEPEAHLHPQMQDVFIRQLDEIVDEFQKQLNDDNKWPVQFVVSTHSAHIANEADFSKVRYFLSKGSGCTQIKDLSEAFNGDESGEDQDFLHKYLSLTKCDLYFADKAVLIEGATERIIFPKILEKMDESGATSLNRKYLSVIEVGGAYAHHFYKFIDFLNLHTLVITDLDSVKKTIDGRKTTYPISTCSEGSHSCNAAISKWFEIDGYSDLGDIQQKTDEVKLAGCRQIAYQVPENDDESACGRSFEDALVLANRELFKLEGLDDDELETKALEKAVDLSKDGKPNFAIKYSIEETDWNVPRYIRDGLIWLNDDLKPIEEKSI